MRIVTTVPVRLGVIVRPEGRSRRPMLSGTPQEDAALTLVVSSKGLQGVEGWLSGLRPSSWTQTATLVSNHAGIEVGNMDRNVIGKIGSDEGEATARDLRSKWQSLKDRADSALANPPSWLTTAVDKISVFSADFKQGAQEAWQSYSTTAIENSGSVLEDYHDSVNQVMMLQADLEQAKASGKFSQAEISGQAAKISAAQALIESARSKFSFLSGGASLDDIAQQQYGAYRTTLGSPLVLALWAVCLIAIAYIVYSITSTVKQINPFNPDNGGGGGGNMAQGISTGVIGLALLLILPFLMKD